MLVVHHAPSEGMQWIADTVIAAARAAAAELESATGERVEVLERDALTPDVDECLAADGVILGTPVNFGYISGALKHYFDSTYRAAQPVTKGRPVSWWMRGAHDTTGAETALTRILTGLGWETAAEPVVMLGDVEPHREALETMAQAMVGAVAERGQR